MNQTAQTEAKTELLPCPFCGGEARFWERPKMYAARFTVGCRNVDCFLWIPDDVRLVNLHHYAPVYAEKQRAMNDWNTRALTKDAPTVEGEKDCSCGHGSEQHTFHTSSICDLCSCESFDGKRAFEYLQSQPALPRAEIERLKSFVQKVAGQEHSKLGYYPYRIAGFEAVEILRALEAQGEKE